MTCWAGDMYMTHSEHSWRWLIEATHWVGDIMLRLWYYIEFVTLHRVRDITLRWLIALVTLHLVFDITLSSWHYIESVTLPHVASPPNPHLRRLIEFVTLQWPHDITLSPWHYHTSHIYRSSQPPQTHTEMIEFHIYVDDSLRFTNCMSHVHI